MLYQQDEHLIYSYIEKNDICNICYEDKQEFFKCNRCTFISCSRCFNNFYFNDNNCCPVCRNQ